MCAAKHLNFGIEEKWAHNVKYEAFSDRSDICRSDNRGCQMSTDVLVVDDDIMICRIVQRMLLDEQYEVQTSQSVGDAIKAVEEKPFDVYVLDYKLREGSGLDIAERIRSKWGAVPIILISGYDPASVALRAEKLRISSFLEKPFSRETIAAAVKNAIASRAAEAGPVSRSQTAEPKRLSIISRLLARF
jgi:DNA-binding NtrC family response regulator